MIGVFLGCMYTLSPLLYRGPQCKVWDFWIALWGQELKGRGYSLCSDHFLTRISSHTPDLAIFFCTKSSRPNSYWDSAAHRSQEWSHNKNHSFPCLSSTISFHKPQKSQTHHCKGQIANKYFNFICTWEKGDKAKSIAICLLICVFATGCSMECNIHKVNIFNAT